MIAVHGAIPFKVADRIGRPDRGRQERTGISQEIVRGGEQGRVRRRGQLRGEQEHWGTSSHDQGEGLVRPHLVGAPGILEGAQATFSEAGELSRGELCLVRPGEQGTGEGQWGG